MKKLIKNLFFVFALFATFQATAQYCGSSQVSFPACGIQTTEGFGDYNTFTCITRGQTDSLIIPFKVFSQFTVGSQQVNIYKLQFATIDSLPCGLCWSTSKSSDANNQVNEFDPNESGCIKIAGLTNDQAGSYLLAITLNVRISSAPTNQQEDTTYDIHGEPSQVGGISIWVKVIDAGQPCPDTVDQTLLRHPSTSCPTGINEVSKTLTNLSIQPNPVTNEAKVTFSSVTGGTQQISITDILGRQVYSTTMTAKAGANETTIKRNNMPSGIYILYVGNSQGTATKKFVIED